MREDQDWMVYIDGEVRAVCTVKGWGHQIRRTGSARETPVSQSSIDDYEWKLIPEARGELPDAGPRGYMDEGTYYVLSFRSRNETFVLEHDTSRCSYMGNPFWERSTYTEIRAFRETSGKPPPAGWLRDHLLYLTTQFGPNEFSVT